MNLIQGIPGIAQVVYLMIRSNILIGIGFIIMGMVLFRFGVPVKDDDFDVTNIKFMGAGVLLVIFGIMIIFNKEKVF